MLPEFEFGLNPCVCAEERRARRIRARDCLSAASLHETPAGLSTAGCPQRSGGTRTVGSPFFSLGFFGEAKKSESPAAATERLQDSSNKPVNRKRTRLRQAQPDPSIPQDERNRASIPQPERWRKFGTGRFRGQSTNSPSLWPALRVLRFASQRNCALTPKTRILETRYPI